MNNKLLKNNFFESNIKNFKKIFLINANSNIQLNKNNLNTIKSEIYFYFSIKKNRKNLIVEVNLYAWNNNCQGYVPIEYSNWNEKEFGNGEYIPLIEEYYEEIVKNFLNIFKQLRYYWQLKELIYRLENPTFIFHHKLLKLFSQIKLEKIMLKHFEHNSILNVPLLRNYVDKFNTPHIFLPNYINNFSIDGIRISIDLDDNDFAIIEDTVNSNTIISKKEFLKRICNAKTILSKRFTND